MQTIETHPEVALPGKPFHRRPAGSPFILQDNGMELRLAEGRADMIEAFRLRYDVFKTELGLGMDHSPASGLDQDVFDGCCDHLLVIDKTSDSLVGTYRLLPFDRVPSFGYYSETEFHLDNVMRSGLRILELGRSCVALEYRNGNVIRLLFRGIAEYLRRCGANALMGCASVYGVDGGDLSAIQRMLLRDFLIEPELRVTPKRGFDISPFPAWA